MISSITRVCVICFTPLPAAPAEPKCPRCGRLAAPHPDTWRPLLKWWLLSELQVDSFHAWRAPASVWEYKLKTALLGTSFMKPNPWGLPISDSTPIATLYGYALERADAWQAAGSPIAQRVMPLQRTT